MSIENPVNRYEPALRRLIEYIDYDTFKYLERDEDEGKDHFPDIAKMFASLLGEDEIDGSDSRADLSDD